MGSGTPGRGRRVGMSIVEVEDERGYRDLLGRFASGVVIVAGISDGQPVGLACQSFFSLSLSPRLVAIAPSRSSSSWQRIAATGAFAISILQAGQQSLCQVFGRGGQDKFSAASWVAGAHGSPLINGAIGWLECAITDTHAGGDHHLVVGQVLNAESVGSGTGLLFHGGRFGHFARTSAIERSDGTWDEGPWIEGLEW